MVQQTSCHASLHLEAGSTRGNSSLPSSLLGARGCETLTRRPSICSLSSLELDFMPPFSSVSTPEAPWKRWGRLAGVAGLLFMALFPVTMSGASAAPGVVEGITGRILDEQGRGISSAQVELRLNDRRLATAFSGSDGTFRLPLPTPMQREGAYTLHAERIGFHPAQLPLPSSALNGVPVLIRLLPAPLPLPALEVEVGAEACPRRSDPEALALWNAMVGLHPDGLDTLGAASYTLARTDTLGGDLLPTGDAPFPLTPGLPLTPGQRGFSGRLRTSWENRVARDGYAFQIRRSDLEGSYVTWSYAPLEADFASHFATPLFLETHRLREPIPRRGGGWTLAFCPEDSRRPGLVGELELTPDTLLSKAEWRFRTPEPNESAGGWTRFIAGGAEGTPGLLLPLESLVWRRLREGGIQRRAQWYEGWRITPGDSVPFLPERGPVDQVPLLR